MLAELKNTCIFHDIIVHYENPDGNNPPISVEADVDIRYTADSTPRDAWFYDIKPGENKVEPNYFESVIKKVECRNYLVRDIFFGLGLCGIGFVRDGDKLKVSIVGGTQDITENPASVLSLMRLGARDLDMFLKSEEVHKLVERLRNTWQLLEHNN